MSSFSDVDDTDDNLDSGGKGEAQVPKANVKGIDMNDYAAGGQKSSPA